MAEEPDPSEVAAGEEKDDAEEETKERQTRSRGWKGSLEEYVELLSPYFRKYNSLVYKDQTCNQKVILANREMIQKIQEKSPNLSLLTASTLAAMRLIGKENNKTWKQTDQKVEIWAKDHSTALKNLLYATQQQRCKATQSAWVSQLELPAWEKRSSGPLPSSAAAAPPAPRGEVAGAVEIETTEKFEVGFKWEGYMAWRAVRKKD